MDMQIEERFLADLSRVAGSLNDFSDSLVEPKVTKTLSLKKPISSETEQWPTTFSGFRVAARPAATSLRADIERLLRRETCAARTSTAAKRGVRSVAVRQLPKAVPLLVEDRSTCAIFEVTPLTLSILSAPDWYQPGDETFGWGGVFKINGRFRLACLQSTVDRTATRLERMDTVERQRTFREYVVGLTRATIKQWDPGFVAFVLEKMPDHPSIGQMPVRLRRVEALPVS